MSDDIWARMVPTHSGTPSVTLRRDIHIVRTKQELPVPSGRWETTLLPGAWLWLTRLPLRQSPTSLTTLPAWCPAPRAFLLARMSAPEPQSPKRGRLLRVLARGGRGAR